MLSTSSRHSSHVSLAFVHLFVWYPTRAWPVPACTSRFRVLRPILDSFFSFFPSTFGNRSLVWRHVSSCCQRFCHFFVKWFFKYSRSSVFELFASGESGVHSRLEPCLARKSASSLPVWSAWPLTQRRAKHRFSLAYLSSRLQEVTRRRWV